jgi:hypothetical protein
MMHDDDDGRATIIVMGFGIRLQWHVSAKCAYIINEGAACMHGTVIVHSMVSKSYGYMQYVAYYLVLALG